VKERGRRWQVEEREETEVEWEARIGKREERDRAGKE